MISSDCTISYILPHKELYSSEAYGAVSLCINEFIKHSSYKNHLIFGKNHNKKVFEFGQFIPRRLLRIPFVRSTMLYAFSCMIYVKMKIKNNCIIEIHNRPKMLKYFNYLSHQLVIFFHNNPLGMEDSKTVSERINILNKSALILFNSQFTKNKFLNDLNVSKKLLGKCHVVYFGFDFNTYQYLQTVKKQKDIIFIGKLVPDKGCLEFLKAFQAIKDQCIDWKLIIVGPKVARNSDYATKIDDLISSMNHPIDVYDYLPPHETMNLLSSSSIACLPSIWEEPFGRVVMESMAMKCATITTKRGGIPEITGDAAMIVDTKVESIKQALLKLTSDESIRISLQEKGHQRMREMFDLEVNTKRLDQLRKSLIN